MLSVRCHGCKKLHCTHDAFPEAEQLHLCYDIVLKFHVLCINGKMPFGGCLATEYQHKYNSTEKILNNGLSESMIRYRFFFREQEIYETEKNKRGGRSFGVFDAADPCML